MRRWREPQLRRLDGGRQRHGSERRGSVASTLARAIPSADRQARLPDNADSCTGSLTGTHPRAAACCEPQAHPRRHADADASSDRSTDAGSNRSTEAGSNRNADAGSNRNADADHNAADDGGANVFANANTDAQAHASTDDSHQLFATDATATRVPHYAVNDPAYAHAERHRGISS